MERKSLSLFLCCMMMFIFVKPAYAYIDPGTFGMLSQVGYIILFSIASAFMFFFRPIKNLYRRITGKADKSSGGSQ